MKKHIQIKKDRVSFINNCNAIKVRRHDPRAFSVSPCNKEFQQNYYYPDSKLILAQRRPDVIIYVGPMSENNIGPM